MNQLTRNVLFMLFAWSLGMTNATAHKTSFTYVELSDKQLAQGLWSLQLMLPVEELDLRFGLDTDSNSLLSRSELDLKTPDVIRYVTDRLHLSAMHGTHDTPCERYFINHRVDHHNDALAPAVFLSLRFQFNCPARADLLRFRYDLFGHFDAAHRALLKFAGTQQLVAPGTTQVLKPVNVPGSSLQARQSGSVLTAMPGYIGAGFQHILIGWDHLAFLLALIIPLVAAPTGLTAGQIKSVLVMVTVFTVGHSLSLAAAKLGWFAVPARSVEAIIAVSIVAAACICLAKPGLRLGLGLAGGFGLIHGLGFANMLNLDGAIGTDFWIGLIGFNLGVEAGQLLFVALALPVLATVSRFSSYRALVTKALPVLLLFVGAGWFAERLTSIELIPG